MSASDYGGVSSPAPGLDCAGAQRLAREVFGIDAVASPLPSERDQNFMLDAAGGGFVLKLANPAEDEAIIDLQCAALRFLELGSERLPVPRVRATTAQELFRPIVLPDGRRSLVWMVERLPGQVLEESPHAVSDAEIGEVAARLARGLAGFFHPAGRRELVWDLPQAQLLRPLVGAVSGSARADVVAVLDAHAAALPRLRQLPAQFIHNDLNPANLLHEGGALSGVVDFGDMMHSSRVNELAIACAYRRYESADPTATACALAQAWHRITPWDEAELAWLPLLVATRMATTVAVSHWRAERHPENRDYILCHTQRAEQGLAALAGASGQAELRETLARACGFGRSAGRTDAELVASRRRTMGRGLRLFYDTPLHLVSGEGVTLRTADGRSYLDCYNNVAHVGHAHPAVVTAMARQGARLNTNTRYLTDPVVTYAERLVERFPDPLNVVRFTCTGSEATDLALRIAGSGGLGRGTVVSEHAYHGNTALGMAVSPEEAGLASLPSWVAAIPVPGSNGWEPGVAAAIDRLAARGHPVGALLFDTLFTSDGIFVPPAETVRRAVALVRAAGGAWIADEVQAGFGRTGDHFWGFERFGVVPDMVTLGKPMGNGYPMAAIVMTEAMAARMDALYYFNTFAGNPVAAAAGNAVLDVIDDGGLQRRAREVGAYLAGTLEERQESNPGLRELRGLGLHRGIEVVRPGSEAPDAEAAAALLNGMKELGVLIGRTGRFGNVLKIRPPLVFSEADAAFFLAALDTALGSSKLPGRG